MPTPPSPPPTINPTAEAPPRTWAEISISALRQNLSVIRKTSGQQVMAVLKAGAYGHDIEKTAATLEPEKLAFFGVASVIEARKLNNIGIRTRLYLLGPTFADERAEIVAQRWTPSISSIEEAEHFDLLNSGKPPLPVHVTIDTGMGRGGFLPSAVKAAVEEMKSLQNLQLEGIGSHLPSADEDREFTLRQFEQFESAVQSCDHRFQFIHLANSAGILGYTSSITNLVRPGLMLYGISPLPEFQHMLTPAMTLKSRISIIRELPQGHSISYGRSTILERDSRIATIGAGYGDGYPRSVSHHGAEVFLRGTRCPILGRVTMDQVMVDVTDLPEAQAGDTAELFGSNILATEVAENADTIAWEILTRITPRVTRHYVE